MIDPNKYFWEGEHAYWNDEHANPYPQLSHEWAEWNEGYNLAYENDVFYPPYDDGDGY